MSKSKKIVAVTGASGLHSFMAHQILASVSIRDPSSFEGAETYANYTFGCANVKGVAEVHNLAFESPPSNGRYLMVERTAHQPEVVKILRELYPSYKLPEKCGKKGQKALLFKFTPLKECLKETVESLKEKNFFKATSAI